MVKELYQYEGEPTIEEIEYRYSLHHKDRLIISRQCPACAGNNTEWVRNQYHICYDCRMAFTHSDVENADKEWEEINRELEERYARKERHGRSS